MIKKTGDEILKETISIVDQLNKLIDEATPVPDEVPLEELRRRQEERKKSARGEQSPSI